MVSSYNFLAHRLQLQQQYTRYEQIQDQTEVVSLSFKFHPSS